MDLKIRDFVNVPALSKLRKFVVRTCSCHIDWVTYSASESVETNNDNKDPTYHTEEHTNLNDSNPWSQQASDSTWNV